MNDTHLLTLLKAPLFKNITKEELSHLLNCLKPLIKDFKNEELIITQGHPVAYVYIILEGQVEISKSHFNGQKNIVSVLTSSNLFGEGIVCTASRHSPVSAISLGTSKLLCVPYQQILGSCSHSCGFHHQLIYNMMLLLGEKNFQLNTKMDLLLLKGLREKLATYLLRMATEQNSSSFTLHLNRNQLAEYLNVSRPSMCRELKKMKDEQLIDYYQNSFKILDSTKLKQFT